MREVSFDEYIENQSRGLYKHGAIIPMSEETIRRVGKLNQAQLKADESNKQILHFIEIEHKETPRHIKALAIMQTVVLFCVLLILAFK